MVYILLAPGFEEIEALAPADLMRRAGLEVALVSVTGEAQVPGSHNISVTADCTLDQVEPGKCRLLMLPGGMGGVNGIKASAAALKLVETIHGHLCRPHHSGPAGPAGWEAGRVLSGTGGRPHRRPGPGGTAGGGGWRNHYRTGRRFFAGLRPHTH